MAQQALSSADCSLVVTLLFQQVDQPFQRLEKLLAQAVALWQDPFIITTWQQITPVQVHRFRQGVARRDHVLCPFCLLRPGQRLFKVQHIDRPAPIRLPLQPLPLSLQESIGIGQGLAQFVDHIA